MNPFNKGLEHNISIYVPSTIDVSTPTDNTDILNDVINDITILVGGCTTYDVKGAYMSHEHGIIREPITIVSANVDSLTDVLLNRIHAIARGIRERMNQESVSVMIDNVLHFV